MKLVIMQTLVGLNFALIKEGREGGKENSSLEKQIQGIMVINSSSPK